MSLEKSLVHLKKENVEFLRLFFREYTYQVETILFYRAQIPPMAYLLTSGLIKLKKNRNILHAPINSLIGARELFSKGSANYQASITPRTKIIGIDLYTFDSFIRENPLYFEIFNLEIS